jgi:molybdate transport system ATP-binding protein
VIDVDIHARSGTFELSATFRADAPIVGLFGRSGAGKTTVVNAIAGIGKPDRGSISINGTMLFDSTRGIDIPPERRRIGYVFQDALLFPHLDVQRNLLYGQKLCPAVDRFIEPARIVGLLGLDRLLRRAPMTLSGGERQRVAIGRALLAQPRILLMDEPLVALDAARKDEVLEYIERLRDDVRIPIVYVTHSRSEIARLADAVVVLTHGRCTAVGNAESMLNNAAMTFATDRYDDGALIEARVTGHDSSDRLTTLDFDGGQLIVPQLDALPRDRVRVRIRARDVSLAIARPSGISTLNVLPGIVTQIGPRVGASVDVDIAVGSVTIKARVTQRSLRELRIDQGRPVHALVKAVSLEFRGNLYD